MSERPTIPLPHIWGCTHEAAPLEIRERITLNPEQVQRLNERLRSRDDLTEFMVLATCNRTEILFVPRDPKLPKFDPAPLLAEAHGESAETWATYGRTLSGQPAVEHLYSVCAGLASQMLGETEILGQVKEAYEVAQREARIGPSLHRLLQKSFQAAKYIRTHSDIGRGNVSIGSLTVDLARRIFGNLRRCRILVIGAGEVANRTLQSLRSEGARELTIVNRTLAKAEELAREFEGVVLPFENLNKRIPEQDIVICSATVTEPLILPQHIQPKDSSTRARFDPLFLIDLALPRNVHPDAAGIDNVYLYNLDDLAEISAENLRLREAELQRCNGWVHERAERFCREAGFSATKNHDPTHWRVSSQASV